MPAARGSDRCASRPGRGGGSFGEQPVAVDDSGSKVDQLAVVGAGALAEHVKRTSTTISRAHSVAERCSSGPRNPYGAPLNRREHCRSSSANPRRRRPRCERTLLSPSPRSATSGRSRAVTAPTSLTSISCAMTSWPRAATTGATSARRSVRSLAIRCADGQSHRWGAARANPKSRRAPLSVALTGFPDLGGLGE